MRRTHLLLLLLGCASAPAREQQPSGTSAAKQAALTCPAPPRGLSGALTAGGLVLVGEIHGTREVPALFGNLACHAAALGRPLWIGLEMTPEAVVRVEEYLSSDRSPCDREILVQGAPWNAPFQSGKSSEAMLDLFDALARLRAGGTALHTFGFEQGPETPTDRREAVMAGRVLEARGKAPNDTFVLLTGNVHSRTREGTPWDPKFRPMGLHLREAGANLVALDLAHAGGSAWICRSNEPSSCGPAAMRGEDRGPSPFVELFSAPRTDGHQGIYYVGPISPSRPARDSIDHGHTHAGPPAATR
jgi:hypothetical protein